ncbi:MAG: hypothetical protein GY842_16225 [bacterium]|nr:hypothetical protein [bacterium]
MSVMRILHARGSCATVVMLHLFSITPSALGGQDKAQKTPTNIAEELRIRWEDTLRASDAAELAILENVSRSSVVGDAEPPWPDTWVSAVFTIGNGVWASPQAGITYFFVPNADSEDITTSRIIVVRYADFAILFQPDPSHQKEWGVKCADRLGKELSLPEPIALKAKNRLQAQSELQLHVGSWRLAGEPWLGNDAPLEELLYRTLMAHVLLCYGTGDHCRQITHGDRTVLCYSNADIFDTKQPAFLVFRAGEPYYEVSMVVVPKSDDPAYMKDLRSRLAGIYRSILMFALDEAEK